MKRLSLIPLSLSAAVAPVAAAPTQAATTNDVRTYATQLDGATQHNAFDYATATHNGVPADVASEWAIGYRRICSSRSV